jgi:hypothetical protein
MFLFLGSKKRILYPMGTLACQVIQDSIALAGANDRPMTGIEP